jgi:hypothetical protein
MVVRPRDVGIGEPRPDARPHGPKPHLAVVEIGARPATTNGFAVDVAGPSPLQHVRRQTGRAHDPACRQAAPDHGEVVGVRLAADHGGGQGDGFVVGHSPCSGSSLIRCDAEQDSRSGVVIDGPVLSCLYRACHGGSDRDVGLCSFPTIERSPAARRLSRRSEHYNIKLALLWRL